MNQDANAMRKITFGPDNDKLCQDWAIEYTLANVFVWVMIFGIIFVNIILKTILRIIIKLEKRHDKTEQVVSTTFILFVMTYINTAVILFMVNMNLDIGLPENFPILRGDYDDFTVDWYKNIGSSIIMTMIIGIFSPHISNSIWWILMVVKRMWDRKCKCHRKHTRQVF